jgi:hypothetical protein
MLVQQAGVTDLLLASGKVLVIDPGGRSAEVYDSAAGTWTAAPGMKSFRVRFTATLLLDGKVLVAGGVVNPTLDYTSTAELFDPVTGTWMPTGSMNHPRANHSATLLPNGKVLVAGGTDVFLSESVTTTAELFDPATGTWTLTGSLRNARYDQLAQVLPDGKVLVAGGNTTNGFYLTSAELYDPVIEKWANTGALNVSRTGGPGIEHATVTLLPNGKVLAAGGLVYQGSANGNLASAELYDPGTGSWLMTGSLPEPRSEHTATLLSNGQVLVAGGTDAANHQLSTAPLYDPASGTWTHTASLLAARTEHGAVLLPNGKVLVMAGDGTNSLALASAEIYDSGVGVANFSSQLLPPSVGLDGLTVRVVGTPGLAYGVQRAPTLSGPWTTLVTITIGAGGMGIHLDSKPTGGQAFYRAIHQP